MRRSKLILATMAIMLLFVSFLSVPALSGENPWDADDGDSGTTGTPPDSAKNDAGSLTTGPTGLAPVNPGGGDNSLSWYSGLMLRMSHLVVKYYYVWTSPKAQVVTAY